MRVVRLWLNAADWSAHAFHKHGDKPSMLNPNAVNYRSKGNPSVHDKLSSSGSHQSGDLVR
jgi:hypothetical protein